MRLGASFGLSTVFRGFAFLVKTPAAWGRAAVPPVLFLLLLGAAGFALVSWFRPVLLAWLGAPESGGSADWRSVGTEALAWLATLLAFGLAAVVALLLTPPLAAPALEGIVALRERSLGIVERPDSSFWDELRCGLRAQLFGAFVVGPIALGCWLGGLLLPALAPVLTPISILCTCFGVAWSLLDYPLTLRGVGARERFAFVRRNALPCIGFGAGFAALFWIPCFGILFLGAAVSAATELVWRLAAADPDAPGALRKATRTP
jgi:uncharacterized protein involved in cysteine biosynthesis